MNNITLRYDITTKCSSHRLSFNPPYNIAVIGIQPSAYTKTFRCRITKLNEQFDPTIGVLVTESYNHEPGIRFTFNIDATLHLLQGEGLYQITLYAEDVDGHWNEEAFFLTIGTGGTHEQFVTSDGFKFKTTYSEDGVLHLSFEANGGKGTQNTIQVRANETLTIPACSLTYPGGTFTYWSLQSDPTVHYNPGDTYQVTANTTLVANWSVISYVTFSSLDTQNSTPITLKTANLNKTWNGTMYYSYNTTTWQEWDGTLLSNYPNIYIRGENNTFVSNNIAWNFGGDTTAGIGCSGNIEKLLDYNVQLGQAKMKTWAFANMFSYCTLLKSAPELPTEQLTDYCYAGMFNHCSQLLTAPELPSHTLAMACYQSMFSYCTNLINAPRLPATTLASFCYQYMFEQCKALTILPALPAKNLGAFCYENMFYGVDAIQVLPELPATVLQQGCYKRMFYSTNFSTLVQNTYSSAYPYKWSIPIEGTIVVTPSESMSSFCNGKTIYVNTAYYVARKPV